MQALSILIKPVSSSCSLDCDYCFYNDLADQRMTKNYGKMNEETMTVIIKKAMAAHPRVISFAFQGGEPMLIGLPFYYTFVALVEKYNTSNIPVFFSIQTNGYHITDDWIDFLKTYRFLVGISVDGIKAIHNQLRQTKAGKPTFDVIMGNIEKVKKAEISFNILCVLTSVTARYIDDVARFFDEQNFKHIQYIPCLDRLHLPREEQKLLMSQEQYSKVLSVLFNQYLTSYLSGDYVSNRLFDNFVGILLNQQPEDCSLAGQCTTYFVIEANGDVFPCDFYVDDEFLLGSILDESYASLFHSDTAKSFRKDTVLADDCLDCPFLTLCKGGCKRYKVGGKYAYCEAYQTFFNKHLHELEILAHRVKTGQISE